ncbi:helix-turn-helix domain-containing protein [Terrilactibacillus sp. BCM23-1]|uniref:Helix-turn-helix domain-containing protein n=1 Tax=Terrilactibacillus tamarindi TaxID=2599694 RepID=A0A6N8CSZ8_9BACI|nr:helix-turn-helix transcriptional regulator [Terrilactibacillus tamarindi]MTT32183.1 helix-turn-helix domain-containing protein [Terrilactibacillus tamarindi]
MTPFPERLRNLREEAGYKQEDMAKLLNISTSAYGYYEQGRNEPSLDALQKIAQIFVTSADYLIGSTDRLKPETYIQVSDNTTFSETEIQVLHELKKYTYFFEDLIHDPDKKVATLYRFWKFLQQELNNLDEPKS